MLIDLLQNTQLPVEEDISKYDGPFVAVSRHTANLMVSDDGLNWVTKALPAAANGIAYGNGQYVMIGTNNRVYSSPDLINWTLEFPTSQPLKSIAYGNGRFVISSQEWDSFYKTDKGVWTHNPMPVRNQSYITRLRFANGVFILCITNNAILYYSTDGINWNATNYKNGQGKCIDAAYGNGKFLISTEIGFRIDTTLHPDLPLPTLPLPTGSVIAGLHFDNSVFIGGDLSDSGRILTSNDGINWTHRASLGYPNGGMVGASRKGISLMGNGFSTIMRSTDKITWETVPNWFRNNNFFMDCLL